MQLKKLTPSFYQEHTHLIEALDNINGHWQSGKTRGYGVVVIELNGLIFAIPLRSNIRHKAAYITVKSPLKGIFGKGLDFSKALLITDFNYISTLPFKIEAAEHKRLQDKEFFIKQSFEKYISKYIKAVNAQDRHILRSMEYNYTTLKNYHLQLGLSLDMGL